MADPIAPGDPGLAQFGPGRMWYAPLGTPVPTDLTTAWTTVSAAWTMVGLTEHGHEYEEQPTVVDLMAAELLDPVVTTVTELKRAVNFSMEEITSARLTLMSNGGTVVTTLGVTTFTPPGVGQGSSIQLGWESDDLSERWVWLKCRQIGRVLIPRDKGKLAVIPVSFRLETPPVVLPTGAPAAAAAGGYFVLLDAARAV